MKEQKGFLQGAAILTLSTVIVKVIGLFYKVPLQNIIDPSGFGYFTTAYDIYSILLKNCVIVIGASAMIYFILILCSHVLTKDDLEFMPALNKKWLTKWL